MRIPPFCESRDFLQAIARTAAPIDPSKGRNFPGGLEARAELRELGFPAPLDCLTCAEMPSELCGVQVQMSNSLTLAPRVTVVTVVPVLHLEPPALLLCGVIWAMSGPAPGS